MSSRQFPKIFYVHRKPGKSSPRSLMFFPKRGPKFATLTAQQKKIRDAGKKCGAEIAGKYTGSANVRARRQAMANCILKEFGYPERY